MSNFICWCLTLFVVHTYFQSYQNYSTVTDFARLRGLSTSVPRASAVW